MTSAIAETAKRLRDLARAYDEYEYMDCDGNGVDFIEEIGNDLASGRTAPYVEYLETVLDEAYNEAIENEAVALINLLTSRV